MKLVMLFTLVMLTALPHAVVYSADDKALKSERREAQKERQKLKRERAKQNNAASKEFRQFSGEIKKEYQERLRDLDTDYRLQKEELRADRQMKTAEAEAEMQQNISKLFLSGQGDEEADLEKFKTDMKAHADKVQAIKEQAALEEHNEFIDNELRKHELLSERDTRAQEKAKQLGLMKKHQAIMAKAIGGELTDQEKRENEREQKDIERLYKNNQRQLGEFLYGKSLREWQIENKREDFRLKQQLDRELFEINSEQSYWNALMFSPQKSEQSGQDLAAQMSEISKKARMARINYDKEKRKRQITRKEQKREIMGR